MRVAIVGAGISGLAAAYLLRTAHDVEVFERNDYPGGHSNTIHVEGESGSIALDTGFVVYNEKTYPGFTRLLRELGAPTQPSEMSLSVTCRACRLEYGSRGSRGITGKLAQQGNIARPGRWLLGFDIKRFFRDDQRAVEEGSYSTATLGEFLKAKRYGGEFRRHFIIPLASAVWSMTPDDVWGFPVLYLLKFLQNHGLIGADAAPEWRTVTGGSGEYVRRMVAALPNGVHLSTPVRRVYRSTQGVDLLLATGETRRFDRVVMACPAHRTRSLLADASPEERAALSLFKYTTNRVLLHTDTSVLPASREAWSSWNYSTEDCRGDAGTLRMTYHLNRLQAIPGDRHYCVSVNPDGSVRRETVLRELEDEHPQYTFATMEGQRRLEKLNGTRGTFFAGAHLGYGFHEDGFASGARVAEMLGVRW